MKQSLELKLSQRLALTPQLQQAIRLLQLSTFDLRAEVQNALEENPLLEELDESGTDAALEPAAGPASGKPDPATEPSDAYAEWTETRQIRGPTGPGEIGDFDIDQRNSAPRSLRDHLFEQVGVTPLSDLDHQIAVALIDAIDDNGYLVISLEDVRESIEADVEIEEIEAVLHFLQNLDPVGVAARDLRECLSLQLRQSHPDTPELELARSIVDNHLELLGARDLPALQKVTGVKRERLREAINLIQNLHPRPGSSVASATNQYVLPDLLVQRINGQWRVELNPSAVPRISINRNYEGSFQTTNSSDRQFFQNHLQEARWFVKSIENRNQTLVRVAREIVKHQRAFLEKGEQAMKPLVLQDISNALQLHESTVSRATSNKFILTPRGVFELKYFFSSGLATNDGGSASATAIQSRIRQLIGEEPEEKPYSDSKIVQLLAGQGISVARRTVAKYREAMNIPPSSRRKSL